MVEMALPKLASAVAVVAMTIATVVVASSVTAERRTSHRNTGATVRTLVPMINASFDVRFK